MRNKVIGRHLLPVAVGIIAGVMSSFYFGATSDSEPLASSASTAARDDGSTRADEPAGSPAWGTDERIRVLERRVSALADDRAVTDRGRPPVGSELDERQREAADRRNLEAFVGDVEAHGEAAVDGEWSTATTASIAGEIADVAAILEHEVSVETVDCRTDSCLAILEFPDYGAARDAYAAYVMHPYEARCMRTSFLEPPADESLPYRANVLFHDCQHR